MRKSGYYWVRMKTMWLIRYWNADDQYWVFNNTMTGDDHWDEVDERQITRQP